MVSVFSSEGKQIFFFPCVKEETLGQIPGVMEERTEQQSISEGDIPWVPLK